MRLLTAPICIYCGDPSDCYDHFVPATTMTTDDNSMTVPACSPCNMRLGPRDFKTLEHRIAFAWKEALKAQRGNETNKNRIRFHLERALYQLRHKAEPPRNFMDRKDCCEWCGKWLVKIPHTPRPRWCCDECQTIGKKIYLFRLLWHKVAS